MKKTIPLIIILVLCLLPVSSWAQGTHEGKLTSTDSTPKTSQFLGQPDLQSSSLFLPKKIHALFRIRENLRSQGDIKGANASLITIQAQKKREGVRNLKHLSQILIWEADEALQQGESSQADFLMETAKELSPDFPPVYSFIASRGWSEHPTHIIENFSNTFMAWKINLGDFWYFLNALRTVFIALFITLILFLSGFSLLILIRSFPSLSHHLWEWSGKSLALYNLWGINLIFLSIPLFLGLNVLWVILTWATMAWMFSLRKEKFVMGLTGGLIVVILFTGSFWGVLFSAEKDQNLQVMNDSLNGEWISNTRVKENQIEKNPWYLTFTYAAMKSREGFCDQAIPLYQSLLKKVSLREKPLVLNNLGNCYFSQNDYSNAIKTYEIAIQEFPSFVTPYYNLSQTYRNNLDFEKGDELYRKALEKDEKKVSYYSHLSALGDKKQVIDQFYGVGEIWNQVFLLKEGNMSKKIWEFFVGNLSKKQVSFFLLCWASILVILTFKGSGLRTTKPCRFCNNTICKKCQRNLMDQAVCRTCWDDLKGKSVTSLIKNNKKRMENPFTWPRIIMGFLIPGSHSVLIQKSIQGALWLLIFFFIVILFFFTQTSLFIVTDGINMIQGPGTPIPWVLVLTLIWAGVILNLKRDFST